MHPGGCASGQTNLRRLIQIPLIVVDSGFLKNRGQLFSEGLMPMMGLLIGDVVSNGIMRGGADGKGRIAFLPLELRLFEHLPHPGSGSLLQFTHEIGKAMRWFQTDQQVDMIRHAPDSERNASQTMHRSAEVSVETVFPFGQNHRLTILGREHQMEEEAGVGRGHVRALLAPRWGAIP